MKVDLATNRDVPAILELWLENMEYHTALDPSFARSADGEARWTIFLMKLIASKEAIVLVTRDGPDGPPVGYAMARVMRDPPVFARMPRGALLDFYLLPDHRRRGAGSAMLERIKQWFADQGITRLEVNVHAKNAIGSAFWRKQGFAEYLQTLYLETD